MKFKSIMNLGLLAGVMTFASCGDSSNVDSSTEIAVVTDLEDIAFQKEVSEEEIRLEQYIIEINEKIELAKDDDTAKLRTLKTEAVKMLLELRADYIELTEETAAKWVVFQEGVNKLIPSEEEEINYAQSLNDDNSDS